ncbi:MAG: hypothetical protein ACEQSR_15830 [Candidatus Methylacidiphilales bacterium]
MFGIFLFTAVIIAIVCDTLNIYLLVIIFLLEVIGINWVVSSFNFKTIGTIKFTEDGITITQEGEQLKVLQWNEINNLKCYYRGDSFWKINIGSFIINKGIFRYAGLKWAGVNNNKLIDKIEVNNQEFYIKITQQSHKKAYQNLIDLAFKNGCQVDVLH